MTWLSLLEMGMPVHALDGPLGTVASLPRASLDGAAGCSEVLVLANRRNAGPGVDEFRRITLNLVDRVDNGTLFLAVPARDVPTAGSESVQQQLRPPPAPLTVPLHEEQIDIETRVVELGHIQLQKLVDELIDEREVALRHHELRVERVPVNKVIPSMIEPFMDGDVYVVPVIEEEIVIQRRLRLKEEIRIQRVVAHDSKMMRLPYRRERVIIEEQWHDEPSRSLDGHVHGTSDERNDPTD